MVIFCHGFITSGIENARLFLKISKRLNSAGFSTVLFDYRNCGYSDGDFEDFRLSRAIEDLKKICHVISEEYNSKIILIAQSLGTLVASSNIENLSMKGCLSTAILLNLSGQCSKRYPKAFGSEIVENDKSIIMPKGYVVTREMFQDIFQYEPEKSLSKISEPILFINSEKDNIGDIRIAQNALRKCKNLDSQITKISNANHQFTGSEEVTDSLIKKILMWLL